MKSKIPSLKHLRPFGQYKKLHSKRVSIKILSVCCILLVLGFIFSPNIKHAFAANDFTVSNVTFDPLTGVYSFDYTGVDLSQGSNFDLDIFNTTATTKYWASSAGSCTSSHCFGSVLVDQNSDSGVTQVIFRTLSINHYVSQTLNYPLPLPTTNTPQTPIAGGWTNVGETWTYASADSPTFTFTVPGDLTSRYSPGMRIKLTQSSTIKYFIITAVSYSSPNTTISVYGGTDYTLANAAISNSYYSMWKAPQGFPLDPTKWTVRATSTTDANQTSPTVGTWYNPDTNLNLTIPVGAWNYRYMTHLTVSNSSSGANVLNLTASTSNNSQSDADLTSTYETNLNQSGRVLLEKQKTLVLTSKTTYYINVSVNYGTAGQIGLAGDRNSTNIVEAICAYL